MRADLVVAQRVLGEATLELPDRGAKTAAGEAGPRVGDLLLAVGPAEVQLEIAQQQLQIRFAVVIAGRRRHRARRQHLSHPPSRGLARRGEGGAIVQLSVGQHPQGVGAGLLDPVALGLDTDGDEVRNLGDASGAQQLLGLAQRLPAFRPRVGRRCGD